VLIENKIGTQNIINETRMGKRIFLSKTVGRRKLGSPRLRWLEHVGDVKSEVFLAALVKNTLNVH
jgi:hypothetical protein